MLKDDLERWKLPLSSRQEEQFEIYYDLLIRRNEVMNLTAITEKTEVYEKHFLDSLALTQALSFRGDESLIDLGTGAGFPGIPLKILFPDLSVVLADALLKRVGFLNEVIEALKLEKITAVHSRAEDLGHDPAFREKSDFCVSRAVAPLNILAEYCLPLVKTGGVFAAYKSAAAKEEAEEANNAFMLLGGGHVEIREMTIGPSRLLRSFVLVEKSAETPAKYPRAKIKKKPL